MMKKVIIIAGLVLVIHGADDLQTEQVSRIYVDAFPNAEFATATNDFLSKAR